MYFSCFGKQHLCTQVLKVGYGCIGTEIAHVLLQQCNCLAALALGKVNAAAAHSKGEGAAQFELNALSQSLAPILVVGICECNARVVVHPAVLYSCIGNLDIHPLGCKSNVVVEHTLHVAAV